MSKIFLNIIKKIAFSMFILYGYNVIAQPLRIIVPINLITVGSMTILGYPTLFAFIMIHYLVY